jgi:predicted HicB family RNase H-like nuclease
LTELCKEIGGEPEKPYSGKLLIRAKPEIHRDLSLIAQWNGESINALVAGQLTMVAQQSDPSECSPGADADNATTA